MTRELVSGRDFQLRYALWRALHLAMGDDPLATQAACLRLEWPLATGGRRKLFVDVLVENAAGEPLEIVECKEHATFLPRESLVSFARDVRALLPLRARFRFATNARFLREGGKVFDFALAGERREVLAGIDDVLLDDHIQWETGVPEKSHLTAEAIFHLASASPDARAVYARLYARLAAQMAQRLAWDGDTLRAVVSDLQTYVFGERPEHVASASVEQAFPIDELRAIVAKPEPRGEQIAVADLWSAFRRDLFGETKVTLEQIFVDPQAQLEGVETGGGTALLFRWLTERRQDRNDRRPLLVIGPFGSGKSTLLTSFGVRLAESTDIIPLLVPLRDVITAGEGRSLRSEVIQYVRDRWRIDLQRQTTLRYCLLCDGFDELNLYYSGENQDEWVRQALRDLASLAAWRDVAVIISSRPVLLMSERLDVDCSYLTVEPFDDERIRIWCSKYRAAAELPPEFSWSFLEERNLAEVAQTPIVLYMLARIYETAPELLARKRYTRAEVYKTFIDWTERTGGYVRDKPKHRVPRNYREILQEIAWAMLESGEGIVGQHEVLMQLQKRFGSKVEHIPVDENLLVAHMLRPVGTASGGRDLIEFSHQSFREYLVAERVWTLLLRARQSGEPPEDATFLRPLAQAEIDFLSDMIAAASPAEAARLANALMSMDDEVLLEVESATILAIKAAGRGGRAAAGAEARLRIILIGLLTPGRRGFVLNNLAAMRMDELELHGAELSEADLTGVRLSRGSFTRASFAATTFTGARFRSCDFSQTLFRPYSVEQCEWEDCDFSAADITLEGPLRTAAERVRFVGCSFDRARIQRLHLAHSTIAGCSWTGTAVGDVVLENCDLDRTAHDFLVGCGARLENCRMVGHE